MVTLVAFHAVVVTIRGEHVGVPLAKLRNAEVMTDDFSPVEFLDAMKAGNTTEKSLGRRLWPRK